MRLILVPVADRPECARALRTAFDLGRRLDASLSGCHIRPHTESGVALPSEFGSMPNDEAAWASAWKGSKSKKSSAAARSLFEKIAGSYGFELIKRPKSTPGALWQEKVGSPDKVLSIMGPVSDLIVVSRPLSRGGELARMFMLSAVLNTSRPVLVLPQSATASIGKRIAIAWNQSAEAAGAAAAAIPLLQRAEKVSIITCGSESGLGPKSGQLATYLKFWGIRTERIRARGNNDAQVLINSYRESHSDLLVMGGYSRSRLRQRLFGGVTEYMLRRANIPVFMLHT